jgi:alkanesulfonate monooxygenase SsuD/methylene tetrahydromethanopterin reductase-like flavin-dependent oxidoreductase (luciferase family)
VHYGVTIPNVGQFGDARVLADLAVAAEAAGWDGCFFWDHLLYNQHWPVADPWVAVAAAAARTERIRVGVLVAALPRYRPWRLAKTVATLDQLSGGRMVFAAGLGSIPDEYARFGEPSDAVTRAAKLDEALEIVDELWRGEAVIHDSTHYEVDTWPMLPTPVQRPRPPIWIGGRWPAPRPFRRAARWDGVMPTHTGYTHGTTISAEDLAEPVHYTLTQRTSEAPFDVILEGESPSDPAAALDQVAPYADVGVTWWVEKLGWWRGELDAAHARVAAGPPG